MAQTIQAQKLSANRCSLRRVHFASRFVLLGMLLGVVYYGDVVGMVNIWPQTPYGSCGFLIPLLACYRAWYKDQVIHNKIVVQEDVGVAITASGLRPFVIGIRQTQPRHSLEHGHFPRATF